MGLDARISCMIFPSRNFFTPLIPRGSETHGPQGQNLQVLDVLLWRLRTRQLSASAWLHVSTADRRPYRTKPHLDMHILVVDVRAGRGRVPPEWRSRASPLYASTSHNISSRSS
mmetsp:Transcript_173857/g.551979  ORF Transcript_173857/g.551979 Transcript_173857/m.551979 type:complete len:114 (-) Transcript_173857:91-432(-)